MRRPLALFLFLVAACLAPSTACAHGGSTGGTDYLSTVVSAPLGLTARMVGGDDRIQVIRTTPATIIVLGYGGEPYLRLDTRGTWENARSPAIVLNDVRHTATVSPEAKTNTPQWVQTGTGTTVVFHDHRAHWMASQPPAVVRADPSRSRTLYNWSIPVTVAGRPAMITGNVAWVGAPRAWLWWLIALGVVVGAFAAAWRLRLAPLPVAAVATTLTILAATATGISQQLDLPDSTNGVLLAAVIALVLLGAGLVGAFLTRRTPAHAVTILVLAGLIAGGIPLVGVAGAAFSYGLVPGPLPTLVTRLLVIAGLAALSLTIGIAAYQWRSLLSVNARHTDPQGGW